jgi:hypothetical protein
VSSHNSVAGPTIVFTGEEIRRSGVPRMVTGFLPPVVLAQ